MFTARRMCGLLGVAALLLGAPAGADGVRFSVSVGGGYCPPPAHYGGWGYAQRPVYVPVRPVYVAPVYYAPVYYRPEPPRVVTYVRYSTPAYSRPAYSCPPVQTGYGASVVWSSSSTYSGGYSAHYSSGYGRPSSYHRPAHCGPRYERGGGSGAHGHSRRR